MRMENKSRDNVSRNLVKITFFALALVFLIFNTSILVNASSPVTFGSAINLSNDSGVYHACSSNFWFYATRPG